VNGIHVIAKIKCEKISPFHKWDPWPNKACIKTKQFMLRVICG